MAWLRTILSELFGLFVDDGSFAAAILSWAVIAGLALPHLDIAAAAKGPILFLGLAAILVESTTRKARKGK